MDQKEYDQRIREIAQRGEIPYPRYFSRSLHWLYQCLLEEEEDKNNTKDEEDTVMEMVQEAVKGSCKEKQRTKKDLKEGTEFFLLENPDGSCCGIQYKRDNDRAFEVLKVAQIDKCRESVAMTSGLLRVFKNIQ